MLASIWGGNFFFRGGLQPWPLMITASQQHRAMEPTQLRPHRVIPNRPASPMGSKAMVVMDSQRILLDMAKVVTALLTARLKALVMALSQHRRLTARQQGTAAARLPKHLTVNSHRIPATPSSQPVPPLEVTVPALKPPAMGNLKAEAMASSQATAASSRAPMGSSLPTTRPKATASRVSMAVAVAVEEAAAVGLVAMARINLP